MRFNILYVDPPWKYRNDGSRGKLKGAVSKQYNSLSIEDLKKLHIDKITEKNCILYLWVTNPFIREGLELLDAWGFEYKTMLTWVKKSYGLGYYYRSKTEHILLGIKGQVKAFRSTRTNIIHSQKKVYRHSEKPEVVRDLIDELDVITHPKKLEIFARRNHHTFIDDKSSWTFIGNEVNNGKDIREIINELADTT